MKIQTADELQQLPARFSHRAMWTMAAGSNHKTKGNQMKMNMVLPLLALGASAFILNAQDAGGPPPGGGPGRPGGPGGRGGFGGQRPPPDLIIRTLDANRDGVIDADEIANASAALKKLDKNGDGKLTPDELRPPRPQNGQGGRGGPGGPGGRPGGPDGNFPPGPPPEEN